MKMEDQGQLAKTQNVDLPPEIMHDILSRLPVKPLCRFKCVSKPWQSLISDPVFVANYSKAAIAFLRRRRLFFTYFHGKKIRVYSLNLDQQLLNENPNNVDGLVASPTELDFGRDWRILGGSIHSSSSAGLFLCELFSSSRFEGWGLINPVTKESKKLPKPPILRLPLKPYIVFYGLGFDHSTNEHKVINGQEYWEEGIVFSVYTLQTDSWRQIDHLYPYTFECGEVLVNGAVHWLVSKVADRSRVIISFHLAEEEVREIALPPDATDHGTLYSLYLGSFRNSLYVTWSPTMMVNEFWVMKEYGVQESWTKMQISKPYSSISHSGFWTESHDLMVFDSSSLVMYNFNDGTFWNLTVGNVDMFWDIGVYVESLPSVSLRRVKKMNPLDSVLKYLSSCF